MYNPDEIRCEELKNCKIAILALKSALGRTEANLMAAIRLKPVRDLAETLAENTEANKLAEKIIDKYKDLE